MAAPGETSRRRTSLASDQRDGQGEHTHSHSWGPVEEIPYEPADWATFEPWGEQSSKNKVVATGFPTAMSAKKAKQALSKAGLPDLWIMDTGCGFDLIAKQGLSAAAKKKLRKATSSIELLAAGGSVNAKMILPLHSTALNRDVEPLVLDQTPSVLSIGRRCMEEGFGFWWPPGQLPILYLPDGKQITLEVIDYIL